MMDAAVEQLRQHVEVKQLHGANSPTSLEWWYLTGHLWKTEVQNACDDSSPQKLMKERSPDYAIQSTFFLSDKTQPAGLLAHSAESDLSQKKHQSSEKLTGFSSTGPFNPISFVSQGILNLSLGHWRLTHLGTTKSHLTWDLRFDVKGTEYLLNLVLPKDKFWLHGNNGFLKKTDSSGNFYYTHPNVLASGQRIVRNHTQAPKVESVCGQLWFDHEIHVQNVMDVGWKWFGLNFTHGQSLMLYQISEKSKTRSAAGELWDPRLGKAVQLENVTIKGSDPFCSESGYCFPQKYEIAFLDPSKGTQNNVFVASRFEKQLVESARTGLGRPYWEGSVKALWKSVNQSSGKSHQAFDGIGFLEQVP